MTTELQMLVLASVLTVLMSFPAVGAMIVANGMRYGFGNRDEPPSLPPWAGRASRAYRNTLDNLLPFAALVLAAHVAGVSNEATVWGATVFFWARVVYAGIYIVGIPYLRTVAFIVAFGGMLDIARALWESWSVLPPV